MINLFLFLFFNGAGNKTGADMCLIALIPAAVILILGYVSRAFIKNALGEMIPPINNKRPRNKYEI